jgi:signal transduction histidine kinase
LIFETEQVVLRVRDEGVGFKIRPSDSQQRGWGLEGMRERVDSVEGQLNIYSPQAGGTIIEVMIPVDRSDTTLSKETLDEHHPPDVS